jgi:membrane associated rhomboid family serine protease
MREIRRFLAWLTPGTRWLLGLWVAGAVLRFVAGAGFWLALTATAIWHGQIWRAVTYALLPNSLGDFLLNGVALMLLGTTLERRWSCRTLLVYSLFVVAATGLSMAAVQPTSTVVWRGSGPLLFGLLAAWGRICGHERIRFGPSLELTAMKAALVFGAASLLLTAFMAGWMNALFAGLGAAWGLGYLWTRSKMGEIAARPIAVSQRINRLEL